MPLLLELPLFSGVAFQLYLWCSLVVVLALVGYIVCRDPKE